MVVAEHPLKVYREGAGLTLEDFALKVGSTKSWLSRIESGQDKPSSKLLERLVAAAGGALSPNDFFVTVQPSRNAERAAS